AVADCPADGPRRRRASGGVPRHGVQGAQRHRPAEGLHPGPGHGGRRGAGIPAQPPGQEPAAGAHLHGRDPDHGQLRPLHDPGDGGHRGRPGGRPDVHPAVRRPRRPAARAALRAGAAEPPGRRPGGDGPAPGPAALARQAADPRRLRAGAVRRPGGPVADLRRRAGRGPGYRAPHRRRPGTDCLRQRSRTALVD
ncbi:MAG: Transcriptional regulator, LacI family, partial [uncultured Friedmanniella sp.]